jgi:PleD family two-component response regulator
VNDRHIHIDPLLAEVFELLHRMTVCKEDTPATRYAGEALRKLTKYEEQQRSIAIRSTEQGRL